MERRLAAILAADVVGYSRLVREDEEGTLRMLGVHGGMIDERVGKHRGRIFGSAGDSVIAEFVSPVEAVRCAMDLQHEFAKRNADIPEDRRMEFRIGVNLGDVVVKGEDLLGDGVNIAARLQELADPGGICVSDEIRRHVEGKIDASFIDLGHQALKNIPTPLRVHRVQVKGVGFRQAAAQEDKPSIAVLPFTNMSGDPEQEYFSDGITEDIINLLSRFRSLFVIARNSSFALKGQAVDVTEVGKKLGVRYVVEGSVRKDGNRIRVTVELAEAATRSNLWTGRYDRDLEDVFAVQDELVRTIVSTVGGRLDAVGQIRAERLSPSDLKAYDHVLRAMATLNQFTKEGNAQARKELERAIELDPRSSQAHYQLSIAHFMDWMAYWVVDRERSLAIAYDFGKKAVALDDTDATAFSTLGMCHIYHRKYDDAERCFDRALMLNPNDSIALAQYGFYLTAVGRIDEALVHFDESARMNPLHVEWFNWLRGISLFTAHRYDEAIRVLKSIADPINEVRGWLAVSYAGAGRLDAARGMLEEFLRVAEDDMALFPGRKLAAWKPFWHGAIEYKNDADFEHLYDALRKAGLED